MTVCFAASEDVGIFFVVLFVIGFIALAICAKVFGWETSRDKMARRLTEAKEDYADALDRLARKPGASSRRKALESGRELMAVIEEAKEMKIKVPVVTEMTIQNDLQAADMR